MILIRKLSAYMLRSARRSCFGLAVGLSVFSGMSGCASTKQGAAIDGVMEMPPVTLAASKASDAQAVWRNVAYHSQSYAVSDQRMRIKTDGVWFSSSTTPEQNFFIRAAGETMKSGYDSFVIVHLDFYKPGPQFLSLSPNVNFSSSEWMGSYEDFSKHKDLENMFSSRRSAEKKGLDGVILMLGENEYPYRDKFSAREVFTNLVSVTEY